MLTAPFVFLTEAQLFAGLDTADLLAIKAQAQERWLAPGSYFFHQGDPATAVYLLLEGNARVARVAPNGQQAIVHMLGPVAEMGLGAAMSDIPYPTSAEALTECRSLAWSAGHLRFLMEAHPRLALNALQLVTRRYVELQTRYCELATEPVGRRIASQLLRLAGQGNCHPTDNLLLSCPISRQDIADLTGATLYTVSRVCSRWEQEGIIRTENQQITILDLGRLQMLALTT